MHAVIFAEVSSHTSVNDWSYEFTLRVNVRKTIENLSGCTAPKLGK